jgi:Ca2+-binding EF-hand superfamily protein
MLIRSNSFSLLLTEGTTSFRQNEFKEVYRDPKDFQDNNGEPRYHYVVTGLSPNTKYLFRIRALNGFGASGYTFGYFYTCPAVPPAPMPVKVTANSIHLAWETSKYYEKQLKELRELFDEADVDGNGCISRDEFMEEIERRKPRLMEFLQKITVTKETGDEKKIVPLSIFDAIETDDNESISWEEFMRFFHSTLDLKNETGSVTGGNDVRSIRSGSTMKTTTSSSRTSMGTSVRKTSAGNTSSMQCRYILKQCTNEYQGEYVEIYRGTKPSFVVHGLASGSTYQFRVQAYNDEEMYSLHSDSTIVNTLLQTPSAPLLGETPSCSSVRIKWPAATAKPCLSHESLQAKSKASSSNLKKGAKNDDNVARLLKEWAQETTLDDGTIDFRAKFDRYDVDKSNFIELPEFRTLLEELGVSPTEERIAAYLDEFDTDSDGKISFEEFKEWWNKTDVQYVLKRDIGSHAAILSSAEANGSFRNEAQELGSQMSIVSYRGKDTWTIVNGLEPNTAYTFRVRTVSSHASSNLSESLGIVTAPSAPSCAGVVSALPNQVTLCWYPGVGGASKYYVDCKFMETLPSTESTSVSTRKTGIISTNGEWCRAYEGSDSLVTLYDLLPNTVYRVRVFAVNRNGVMSEQSTVSQFNTLAKEEERMYTLRPSNAADHFIIECAQEGDIVAGDTILFSERLYKTDSGKIVEESRPGARSSSANGATGLARTGLFNPNSSITSNGSVIGGEAVGERTVAARVVSINECAKYGRVLSMEVAWSTVQIYGETGNTTTRKGNMSARGSTKGSSAPATGSASYILPSDSKIQRKERSLYKYEAFRCEWQDEKARHPSTWEK